MSEAKPPMPWTVATAVNRFGQPFFCTFDAELSARGFVLAERYFPARAAPERAADFVSTADKVRTIAEIEWLQQSD
jgi:hypothetical protein